MGDEKKASEYECEMRVTDHNRNNVFFSTTCPVFSLPNRNNRALDNETRSVMICTRMDQIIKTSMYCSKILIRIEIKKKT